MHDKGKKMNRRKFLRTSGLVTTGIIVAASGAVLFAADDTWALKMKTFDVHTAKTLLAMVRATYPHDTLSDIYYAKVVGDLDAQATKDKKIANMIASGIIHLDRIMKVKFVDLSPGDRLIVLKTIENSIFFQKVRSTIVVSLYSQPLVWRHFGYEGPSYKFGGYIKRGFDDLNWLKRPPLDVSPKAWISETPLNNRPDGL